MSKRFYKLAFAAAAAILGVAAANWAVSARPQWPPFAKQDPSIAEAAARVDAVMSAAWQTVQPIALEPMPPADSLLVARRLSLALAGTVPSLEEIRALEKMPPDKRADVHLEKLLGNRRYSDYWAERLARAFVGTDDGPFILYRRRRFTYWLSDELLKNTAYDDLVRQIITAEGLWTGEPATNFITARVIENQGPDPIALAARTARAFLGVRIDCAQCHDHPFADWKQKDFEGLAAFFGQTKQALAGIKDERDFHYQIEDFKTKEKRDVSPRVPFGDEFFKGDGRRREQLAAWITAKDNEFFAKAIANRVWTLMFGQGLCEPVDDLEADPRVPGVLEVLAADFRSHGYDLKRLVRVIANTRAFRMQATGDDEYGEQQEKLFAAFPMTRLRSEQIAGSLVQAASLKTVDANSHIITRTARLIAQADFINHYGDAREEELNAHVGTIPQRLALMNGGMPQQRLTANPLNAAGRIASLSPNDETRVRVAFLVALTRKPSDDELEHFVRRLGNAKRDETNRNEVIEDMFWSLFNSTEFSWNH